MKRTGDLYNRIAEPENLRHAFLQASRGKGHKTEVVMFRRSLDQNLKEIRQALLDRIIAVGRYHFFKVYDPKERNICAASFRERVLHHAIMGVCEETFERLAIFDSYACRRGKGGLAAVTRARSFAGRSGWFLKMDVRKYFDSIDHAILERLLARRFKDHRLLEIWHRIVDSYETKPGKGLPIGNLTSQHWANFYLHPLDRYLKEQLGQGYYVRYMDDFVVWGESRQSLRGVRDLVTTFLREQLALTLKASPLINQTCLGMDFLGYRVYPWGVRLARRSKRRFSGKFRCYEACYLSGAWSSRQLQQRMEALLSFVRGADSMAFRRNVIERFGVVA